ncbi:hypothetical protein CR513_15063, partial [Mucuna pruriens]
LIISLYELKYVTVFALYVIVITYEAQIPKKYKSIGVQHCKLLKSCSKKEPQSVLAPLGLAKDTLYTKSVFRLILSSILTIHIATHSVPCVQSCEQSSTSSHLQLLIVILLSSSFPFSVATIIGSCLIDTSAATQSY